MSSDFVTARLRALSEMGSEATAPLLIEAMAPEEALRAAGSREGSLYRLQEARALLALGRQAEAGRVLSAIGPLPPGLEALRAELSRAWRPGGMAQPRARGAEEELARWLERVRSWRKGAGV